MSNHRTRPSRSVAPWLPALIAVSLMLTVSASSFAGPMAVVYRAEVDGEEATDRGKRILIGTPSLSRVYEVPLGTPIARAPEEVTFFDFEDSRVRQSARLPDGGRCTVHTEFDSLAQLTMTDDREEILGFECVKATTEIRSNKIEIWYTDEPEILGSPSRSLVARNGLILKFVQNGSYGVVAERIVTASSEVAAMMSEQPQPFVPDNWGDVVDSAEYRARVTASYVTTVDVFSQDQVSFGNEIDNPKDPESTETFHFSKGTIVARKVLLPEVDDGTMVLAELVERSNGDAYDRTGSVFLIPTDRPRSFLDGLRNGVEALPVFMGQDGEYQGIAATGDYLPPLELIRVITPFGIGHFNDRVSVKGLEWEDEASYVMDVTDLLPRLQGEVWFGTFIGNYDKGGHHVDLQLRYYPGSKVVSTEPQVRHWTLPLFNTLNAMEMSGQNYGTLFGSDSLTVEFEVPEGVKDVHLRYLTTGHGGWGGGDEFNPKTNTILLDGQVVTTFIPWRSDCGTFREFNPSSGNFWNGISSSDLSRSGWCPGTTVSPVIVPLDDLSPGRHVIQVAIPLGERSGSSFSSWNVSGVLLGEFTE